MVQKDFIETKDMRVISLIHITQVMISSKSHRLIHVLWHMLRNHIETVQNSRVHIYPEHILSDNSKNNIKN